MRLINKKKAMSHIESQYHQWGDDYDILQANGDLEDMDTVDAIPIEWIEEWVDKMKANDEFAEYTDYLSYVILCLREDWEKEQEKKNDKAD